MPRTVFCHDVTTSYPPEELVNLPGVPVYAARVFASTRQQDVVVLPEQTREHFPWIRQHYETIGLPVANEVLFGGHEQVRKLPDHDLSVFFFGPAEHAVRPNQRWFETAAYLNSKNDFVRLCRELKVDTPNTICFDEVGVLGTNLPCGQVGGMFPVYVKVAVSASGFGVWRCESMEEFLRVTASLKVPFQVQEALPAGTEFLNVQYEVSPQGLALSGAVTFQVLRGNTHSGNRYPTPYNLSSIYAVTDPLAKWAAAKGMQGVFAFDVAATPDGRFLPIECNPRWNGASYFSRVAEKLGVDEWESLNVNFKFRSFDSCHLPADLAFSQHNRDGIVIVNWGCVGDGKLGIFAAGNEPTRRSLIEEFQLRFS